MSTAFISVACPKCGSTDSTVVLKGKDYLHARPGLFSVAQCGGCSFWFQNPRPQDLTTLYPGDYRPHQSADENRIVISRGMVRFLRRYRGYGHLSDQMGIAHGWRQSPIFDFWRAYAASVDLVPSFVPAGSLLEIGCGNGFKLDLLRRLGWPDLHGIEMVPKAAVKARTLGFDVECGAVEDVIDRYPDNSLDVVLASMVLEHLSNPFDVVRRINRKLKTGGQFLFSTVVRHSLDDRLYGAYWTGYDFPRHLVYFEKKDLSVLLNKNFESINFSYQCWMDDFKTGSAWKIGDGAGGILDRAVHALASRLPNKILLPVAWVGRTTRVSISCRKK